MNKHLDTSVDVFFENADGITWLPYVGKNYFNSDRKILIVGESHYVPIDEDADFYLDRTWTRQFILKEGLQLKPWNISEKKNNLIREVEKTVLGRTENDFWYDVSYFNLIQRLLPSIKGKDRPNYNDIVNGLLVFKEIFKKIEPEFVLFCGVEAAKHFKAVIEDNDFRIDDYKNPKTMINRCYPRSFTLNYNNQSVNCFFIKHPSSGYSFEPWRDFISW